MHSARVTPLAAASSKSLFRATQQKRKVDARQDGLPVDLPDQRAPQAARDPLDYDPTPRSATASYLAVEIQHIKRHGLAVWECAAGGGHMAKELAAWGLDVFSSDIVDRGGPLDDQRSFYDFERPEDAPADICITNPPYNEISARDGRGAWIRHALSLDLSYVALLLGSDWPAARINGHDQLFEQFPPSIEYRCCWKIDFRGQGQAPQRNSWFVWDIDRPPVGANRWVCSRLYLDDGMQRQGALL